MVFLKAEGNYRVVVKALGDTGFSFHFGLLPDEPELLDSDGRPGRGDVSALLLSAEMLKLLTRSGTPFFWDYCAY